MGFDLSSYEQVKDRIVRFYETYPDGRIETKIEKITDDYQTVIFKAELFKTSNCLVPISTGFALETKGKDKNFTNVHCWLENCETSAIGRALANSPIGDNGNRPSREEMEKVERMKEVKEVVKPEAPKGNFEKAAELVAKCDNLKELELLKKAVGNREWTPSEKQQLLCLLETQQAHLSIEY